MAPMPVINLTNLTSVILVCISVAAACLALNTMWRVFTSRHQLLSESLTEDNRRLLWRVVFFIIFPLANLFQAFATQSIIRGLGAQANQTTYGLYYYFVEVTGAESFSMAKSLLVSLSGDLVLFIFLMAILPTFLLRPNPLYSTLLGYSIVFLIGYNLTCHPIFSALGLTYGPWTGMNFEPESLPRASVLLGLNATLLFLLITLGGSKPVRNWFSQLSRPLANQRLQEAVQSIKSEISVADLAESPALICRLAHLYHLAGLTKESKEHLKMLNRRYESSIYTAFLNATLAYHLKKFDYAKRQFVFMANLPGLAQENKLKADFLAAASCASFAQGKARSAFRLCLKALQADKNCLLAQLIKVDTLLATGKFSRLEMENDSLVLFEVDPQKALDEIVPLDFNKTFDAISRIEDTKTNFV